MKLKVETTKADYDAFYAYTASKLLKPFAWIPILKNVVLWIVIGVIFMSFFQFQSGNIDNKLFFATLVISIPFFIYIALGKLMAIKLTKCFTPNQNGIMIGPKEFEISSDGIKEVHPYGYNFYNWDVVEQVEEVNGSIYVFVDKVLALIFTTESFESAEFKEELMDTLKKYV
ncbi:MAG: YcxB family protein [Colwellia sp.]